ncbi:hypothetical protein [uncultured Tyzzerella sp.]|uniref:hypothetical protein n=1 Tax=uncultured Tyzzerella sp. TaxID=2321398 RepID=UPI0029433098|nr:hypothetical protein [uncultured Tyzzerella sp.]
MKKNKKGLKTSIIAASVTTVCFASYKILKAKYPDKFENFNTYLKNNLLPKNNVNDNIENDAKEKVYNIATKQISTKPLEKTPINNPSKDDTNNIVDDNNTASSVTIDNIDNTDTIIINNNKNNINEDIINFNEDNINEDIINFNDTNIIDNTNVNYDLPKKEMEEDIEKYLDELSTNNNETIILPDKYIEQEIRYQLCLNNDDIITKPILQKLERIDFFEIDDNDMFHYCDFLGTYTKIKSIVIDSLNPLKYGNDAEKSNSVYCLKDVSPLNNLIYLEELSFNWGIENIDFSSLTKLSNLKKLEIKFGMLNDISFISNFKNLEHLEIMLSNNISDLSPILELSKLKRMYIYTNKKVDTDIFKNISSLKYLYINGESVGL